MTWLMWRQHRIEILAVLAGGLALAAALVYGADLAVRVRSELGVDTCQPLPNTNANCVELSAAAAERMQPFRFLVVVLFFVPALVGSFVGGPLFSRELERGTHRFVWTQAVARLRWAAAQLASVVVPALLAALPVALVGGWAANAINGGRTDAFQSFDLEGPALASHVVLAIAVAALVGTLSRRILTGMLGGLLLFGAIQLAVELAVRPYYEPPVAIVRTSGVMGFRAGLPDDAWVVGDDYVDGAGNVVARDRVQALLDAYRPASGSYDQLAYLAQNGLFARVRYQPADRYWRFQWVEGAVFVLLGAACGSTLLLIHRRDA